MGLAARSSYLELVLQLVLLVGRLVGAVTRSGDILQLGAGLSLRRRGLTAFGGRHCGLFGGICGVCVCVVVDVVVVLQGFTCQLKLLGVKIAKPCER